MTTLVGTQNNFVDATTLLVARNDIENLPTHQIVLL